SRMSGYSRTQDAFLAALAAKINSCKPSASFAAFRTAALAPVDGHQFSPLYVERFFLPYHPAMMSIRAQRTALGRRRFGPGLKWKNVGHIDVLCARSRVTLPNCA